METVSNKEFIGALVGVVVMLLILKWTATKAYNLENK